MKPLALLLASAILTIVAVPLALILLISGTTPPVTDVLCTPPQPGASASPPAPTASALAAPAPAAEASILAVTVTPSPWPSPSGAVGFVLPGPGTPRRVSLTNPPIPIPADIEALYRQAAAKYRVSWLLLAGVGMEETSHGTTTKNDGHGVGLMQFLPSTWAEYGTDGDGDGHATITNNADSIFSSARYLAALGATESPDGVRAALGVYNPNPWYTNDVLYYAAAYSGDDQAANPCLIGDTQPGNPGTITGTGPAASTIAFAERWLGTRYSWGGGNADGPTLGICCSPGGQDARGIVGFDCSGLVLYAYAHIGIRLPHLADDITYRSGGQTVPRDFTQMRPGDVIGFSYTPGGRAFHVGIYRGDGTMINSDGHGVSIATLTSGYYSHLAWHIVRFTT